MVSRRIILRSPEEKADPRLSWSRPDEEFFASGACHVLTAAFLLEYPAAGFSSWGVRPSTGDRGSHVVAIRGDLLFDWAGYSDREVFVSSYVEAMRMLVPGWDAELVPLKMDPIGWDFCKLTCSRHSSQFPHDPLPRALSYVRRFPPPV
jgi:hypothetical protein